MCSCKEEQRILTFFLPNNSSSSEFGVRIWSSSSSSHCLSFSCLSFLAFWVTKLLAWRPVRLLCIAENAFEWPCWFVCQLDYLFRFGMLFFEIVDLPFVFSKSFSNAVSMVSHWRSLNVELSVFIGAFSSQEIVHLKFGKYLVDRFFLAFKVHLVYTKITLVFPIILLNAQRKSFRKASCQPWCFAQKRSINS